ncbi:MAG: DUF1553 domain-containing protein [Gemmataceae bacterium]|jgi:Protein of unknown function (DUF1549)/Protein of unknown function (DUF1553)
MIRLINISQLLMLALVFVLGRSDAAELSLHEKIDAIIDAKNKGRVVSAQSDDYEFVRRVYLDFAGRIPTVSEVDLFVANKAADKRRSLIEQLVNSPAYAKQMANTFHIHFMERLGDNNEWLKYLEESFRKNKGWNVMAREILRGVGSKDEVKGSSFFYSKRLENYGQNPVDYSALTRDVGRLFLGKDLRCAECHDHLFVEEYKQADFKGLFAFFQNTYLSDAKAGVVGEKMTSKKLEFMSVFKKEKKEIAPKIPGMAEVSIPEFKKGEEFLVPPDPKKKIQGVPKFSPLEKLSEQLPTASNPDFAKNIVNRIWFIMIGRGLVHPLDLHHAGNPPSHPELLALLAKEFNDHNYDIKWLLTELANTRVYQRSSRVDVGKTPEVPSYFGTAIEKRISAEQLLASIMVATGRYEKLDKKDGKDPEMPEALKVKFIKAFANAARDPEDEIAFSLKAALFLLNDDAVLALLKPEAENTTAALVKMKPDNLMIEKAYLAILSRKPDPQETKDALEFLSNPSIAGESGVKNLVWALLSSSEFNLNH